jgi:hypothetical protein
LTAETWVADREKGGKEGGAGVRWWGVDGASGVKGDVIVGVVGD